MTPTMMLLVSLGCVVGKARYETTLAELNATRVELAEVQSTLDQTQGTLTGTEEELASRNQDIAGLRASLDGAEQQMTQLQENQASLQSTMSQQELALRELEKQRSLAEARLGEYRDLLARFRRLIDSGRLQVKIVDGRMVVELATDILFDSGSAELSEVGRAALGEVASLLADIPDRSFQVEGHTDNVPISTERYPSNWELAAARSITVVSSLVESGLPAERVSAASCAEYRPVMANSTPAGRAANRRIEIVVLPDLSNLPGFEQLQEMAGEGRRPAARPDSPAKIRPRKRGD